MDGRAEVVRQANHFLTPAIFPDGYINAIISSYNEHAENACFQTYQEDWMQHHRAREACRNYVKDVMTHEPQTAVVDKITRSFASSKVAGESDAATPAQTDDADSTKAILRLAHPRYERAEARDQLMRILSLFASKYPGVGFCDDLANYASLVLAALQHERYSYCILMTTFKAWHLDDYYRLNQTVVSAVDEDTGIVMKTLCSMFIDEMRPIVQYQLAPDLCRLVSMLLRTQLASAFNPAKQSFKNFVPLLDLLVTASVDDADPRGPLRHIVCCAIGYRLKAFFQAQDSSKAPFGEKDLMNLSKDLEDHIEVTPGLVEFCRQGVQAQTCGLIHGIGLTPFGMLSGWAFGCKLGVITLGAALGGPTLGTIGAGLGASLALRAGADIGTQAAQRFCDNLSRIYLTVEHKHEEERDAKRATQASRCLAMENSPAAAKASSKAPLKEPAASAASDADDMEELDLTFYLGDQTFAPVQARTAQAKASGSAGNGRGGAWNQGYQGHQGHKQPWVQKHKNHVTFKDSNEVIEFPKDAC